MSEQVSLEELSAATGGLLEALGAAQRGWVRSRVVQGVGITERLATYCALRALTNAFPAEAVLEDAASLELLRKFADSIHLKTASVDELTVDRARA